MEQEEIGVHKKKKEEQEGKVGNRREKDGTECNRM